MERVTVRQIFRIVKDTIKKNTSLIALLLAIQLVLAVISWFVQLTVLSEMWGKYLFQLLVGVAQTFLVQGPIYFVAYCYLSDRPLNRKSIVEQLRQRAVPLLYFSLLCTVASILTNQVLPTLLEQYALYSAPISVGKGLFIYIVWLLIWLLDLAVGVWFIYLTMVIVISEPGEKRLPQRATRILFESFGTRVKLILCMAILPAIPALVLRAFPLSDWTVYLWVSVMAVLLQLADMAILMSLLPKEEREWLQKKAP